MAKRMTRKKAKRVLRHGEVRGHKLTPKQKGLFGLIAGGGKPTRVKQSKRKARKRAR